MQLGKSAAGVLRSMATPWIWIPLTTYLAWLTAAVAGGRSLGVWDSELAKTTVLWVVLSGLALVFDLNKAISRPGFFRRALLRTLGATAVIEFFVTLESFPLWVEIPAQALGLLFAGVQVLVARDRRQASAGCVASAYLALYGVSAVVWSVVRLVGDWDSTDKGALAREGLLPVWLTVVALIFEFAFALVAAYQSSFKRMRFWRSQGRLWRQRAAVLLRGNVRLHVLRLMTGYGAREVARADGFRAAWTAVGQVVQGDRARKEAMEAAARRLAANTGVERTDETGRQLDQREFAATRKALLWLHTCHMGHYRNRGRYRRDLLPLVASHFARDGLPDEHGVEMWVRADGQAWYATRQTTTGWWFAIGAGGPPPDEWLYDGPRPPKGFPRAAEWDRFGGGAHTVNWE